MTRQALAELSALLAQRAVMASPSQVAKDALKLARYADAAHRNAELYRAAKDSGARGEGLRPFYAKCDKLTLWASEVAGTYGLGAIAYTSAAPMVFIRRVNTPPIQGCQEGYAI